MQAESSSPAALPDGLIEALSPGQSDPGLFVLELATYPELRIAEQALRDMALVYLDRGVVPEVLVLVLHPRGNQQARNAVDLPARWAGHTCRRLEASWSCGPSRRKPCSGRRRRPDPLGPAGRLRRPARGDPPACRARIDAEAPPGEHENLLAVPQVLAGLRYNDPRLFELLGGRDAMIESPVLQELKRRVDARGRAQGGTASDRPSPGRPLRGKGG